MTFIYPDSRSNKDYFCESASSLHHKADKCVFADMKSQSRAAARLPPHTPKSPSTLHLLYKAPIVPNQTFFSTFVLLFAYDPRAPSCGRDLFSISTTHRLRRVCLDFVALSVIIRPVTGTMNESLQFPDCRHHPMVRISLLTAILHTLT